MQGGKLLSEQTADKICNYIEENDLRAGDKLPNEFQLAELCEVGRSTIREAIKLLVYSGRLEVIRGSGTYIREQIERRSADENPNDPIGLVESSEENLTKTALEFMDVRLMLEPEIAAIAAANADAHDCQLLEQYHKDVERCILAGQDHIETDVLFHMQIAACTHNQILCNLMEVVTKGIPLFVQVTKNNYAIATIEQHRIIMESIRSGDVPGARYEMVTHLNSNRKCILEAMEMENQKASGRQSNAGGK